MYVKLVPSAVAGVVPSLSTARIPSSPTLSGTFTLTVGTAVTPALAANADPLVVEQALETLPGVSDVVVTALGEAFISRWWVLGGPAHARLCV